MGFTVYYVKDKNIFHNHKRFEISVCIKGTGIFHTEVKDVKVSPGRITITPAGMMHSVEGDDEFERITVYGDFNQFFNPVEFAVVLDNPEKEGTLLTKMIWNNKNSNPEYIASLCNTLGHFLIQSLKIDDELSICVRNIVGEITNNFHDSNLNLCELLNKSGYAEDYIRSSFKSFTGKTPTEFLTNVRIQHACYLIDIYKNSLSLLEIADKCGFTDYSYFSRRFKQVMGMSPRKYME